MLRLNLTYGQATRMLRAVPIQILLLAVLGAQSPIRAQKADGTDQPSARLMQKVLNAWSTLDLSQPRRFYSQQPDLVFYDVTPGQMEWVGFNSYAHSLDGVISAYSRLEMKLRQDAKTHVSGNTAWGTGTWDGVATGKDGHIDKMSARWTLVWQRFGNKWLIVHEHVSFPTPK